MSISISEFPNVDILPYAQAIDNIQSGDILLCSGSSLFSSLIQRTTGSIWSHVAFIIKLKSINRLMVLESVESIGVRTVPLNFYTDNYGGQNKPYPGKLLIARHSDFDESKLPEMSCHAIDLLGHLYDKDEIIKIAARIGIGKVLGPPSCRLPDHDNEFICSEYAYECYKSVGVNIDYDCAGYVTPADFAKTEKVKAICGIMT